MHQKLGGLTSEFEDKINEEIEDLFQEIENERRQALLETLPFERVLSKEDCLRIFNSSDTPRTGSVLGVLIWASELEASGTTTPQKASSPPPHYL